MKTTITNSNGFTLIEVLVAIFIFAVGLLGIAGLQIVAKQNNFDAVQRTTAALLANEIAEKIRANPASAHVYISSQPDLANPVDPLPTTVCSDTAQCSTDNLARSDLREWYSAILGASKQNDAGDALGGLISPSACISSVTNTAGEVVGYDIAIAWRGKSPLANPISSSCGEDEDVYGTGNLFRRVIVFTIAV